MVQATKKIKNSFLTERIYNEATNVKEWKNTFGNSTFTFDYKGVRYIAIDKLGVEKFKFKKSVQRVIRRKDLFLKGAKDNG